MFEHTKNTCLIHPGPSVIANATQHFALHLPSQRHSSQGRVPGEPVDVCWKFSPLTLDPRSGQLAHWSHSCCTLSNNSNILA